MVYVAIPCGDKVPTDFLETLLKMSARKGAAYGITAATLIYDARNTLAQAALETDADKIMWVDSDMSFDPDVFDKLEADIDEGRDFVTGLYFTRKNPIMPVIFNTIGFKVLENGMQESYAGFYEQYPKDQIFEIEAAGFGCCMMTRELLENVYEHYGSPFAPMPGFGEDMSFCKRCRELGLKLYCDSRIKAGHLAQYTVTEKSYEDKIIL